MRIAAAQALDKLGDDAVRETAPFLVGALRGDDEVAKAVAPVLGARKARDPRRAHQGPRDRRRDRTPGGSSSSSTHCPTRARSCVDAFESPAENVQVNAAMGIGMLGEAKRAGAQGKKALEVRRTGGFARTREAVFKALALLRDLP